MNRGEEESGGMVKSSPRNTKAGKFTKKKYVNVKPNTKMQILKHSTQAVRTSGASRGSTWQAVGLRWWRHQLNFSDTS
ncbi:hypothetical protein RRG08_003378 [Elysia crispata]|uniref:Uncharacterized protein n=1 Tax=Elysia crispata TaxID=231223 RepID=A0AAE1ABP1_9GAST|nr:hypothetical protein RRG08_003378 [Elysia crispata]